MSAFSTPLTASQAAIHPADTTTGSSSASSTSDTASATVTANDFLQLLVTELQNQDPTADTDPNEYINQLVQVNSLQQLIQINQDLTPLGSSTSTSGDSVQRPSSPSVAAQQPGETPIGKAAPGNLSPPANSGAAARVANALGTAAQTLAPNSSSSPLDSILSMLRSRTQQAGKSTINNPAR
jgi:flagellar basal-body rod modification protein FlgD